MKVLLINTSEQTGGAAIAAGRLLDSLNAAGVDARMLVAHRETGHRRVIVAGKPWQWFFAFLWERITIWTNNLFSRKNLFTVSIANTGIDVTRQPEFREADVIHLHWINQGMLSLKGIREILESGKPVVWTMHDMWPCTAICHHAYTCEAFKSECRRCRFLRFPGDNDLARRTFGKKARTFGAGKMRFVAVSSWLARQAGQSALLKGKPVEVIPNALPTDRFTLLDRAECRQLLNLPADRHVILFGAARIDDPIKGLDTLNEALRLLTERGRFRREELLLVLFGHVKFPERALPNIPIDYKYIGIVNGTDALSRVYSAAEVTVSASHYETFGQTLVEAQACGCLPVSFGNSGQADIIRHKENGFLAEYPSAESLAEGIAWGLTEGQAKVSREELRREVERRYAGDVVAASYIDLYTSMTESKA